MNQDPAYEQLRRQIENYLHEEKERRARFLFRLNLAVYIFFLAITWLPLNVSYSSFWQQDAARSLQFLTIAGFVQLAIHYASYRMTTSRGERALRERLLGQADVSQADMEKPKRRLSIDDEGELVNSDTWSAETSDAQRRNTR